ncbi:glutamine amidotransferase-like class 1 domain-containing protein 3, mitochondrial [Haliotis rufescens]|uniref:glutamine amidotransferase-like class 1 domain-containing protein 3, mitochondrial n=1 Tax=Haliotis rufescens TaxID=6454 RepID=UPI00201F32E6|nr:glutamine amidotransferase-like class 1 domain-containing protein 3, mitochondrial [Haliotis rufescens]
MFARNAVSALKHGLINTSTSRLIHSSGVLGTKVAVVLSGCGVYDGSEVHEASAILVHLSRGGADVSMFAPDKNQMHVVNHTKGEPMEPNRNVLLESARIARGKVEALSGLKAQNFDAVIFPGGFGAAKNLSTFATEGTAMSVDSDVERVLQEFHTAAKPIGLCCIAPVLAAKVLPGCEVTVGSDQEEGGRFPYAGTAGAIEAMGSRHIKKNVTECHVDSKNKIVTTPAYMCETAVHEIYDGIGTMVKSILGMAK